LAAFASNCRPAGVSSMMRAAVVRVGATAAQASGLDTVGKLARAADGDRQLLLDVKDTARRVFRHHLHRLEPGELQVTLGPKPGVNGIPQISLEADQLAEQHLQIRHDPDINSKERAST
jgi:hypothetical protein